MLLFYFAGTKLSKGFGVELFPGWMDTRTFNRPWYVKVTNARGNMAQPTQGLMPVRLVPALARVYPLSCFWIMSH
jgi:hypothetical protein